MVDVTVGPMVAALAVYLVVTRAECSAVVMVVALVGVKAGSMAGDLADQ